MRHLGPTLCPAQVSCGWSPDPPRRKHVRSLHRQSSPRPAWSPTTKQRSSKRKKGICVIAGLVVGDHAGIPQKCRGVIKAPRFRCGGSGDHPQLPFSAPGFRNNARLSSKHHGSAVVGRETTHNFLLPRRDSARTPGCWSRGSSSLTKDHSGSGPGASSLGSSFGLRMKGNTQAPTRMKPTPTRASVRCVRNMLMSTEVMMQI
jgi:hypothetical protein